MFIESLVLLIIVVSEKPKKLIESMIERCQVHLTGHRQTCFTSVSKKGNPRDLLFSHLRCVCVCMGGSSEGYFEYFHQTAFHITEGIKKLDPEGNKRRRHLDVRPLVADHHPTLTHHTSYTHKWLPPIIPPSLEHRRLLSCPNL